MAGQLNGFEILSPKYLPGGYSLRGEPCISVPACRMWKMLRQLRGNLAASPNRIAFASALLLLQRVQKMARPE